MGHSEDALTFEYENALHIEKTNCSSNKATVFLFSLAGEMAASEAGRFPQHPGLTRYCEPRTGRASGKEQHKLPDDVGAVGLIFHCKKQAQTLAILCS